MKLLTTEDVRAACDEAHDARGYTEANALAEILERMMLQKLAEQAETLTVRYDLSPAGVDGAVRDKLIAMGWTPPGAEQAKAEPVAWFDKGLNTLRWRDGLVNSDFADGQPFFTRPAPAPEGMVTDSCDCVNATMECSERQNCRVSARLEAAAKKEASK